MSRHTPGEWRAVDGIGQYAREVHATSVRGKKIVVARIGGGPLNREGNARLIAAAPDLLEVVQTLLALRDKPNAHLLLDENSPLVDAARAAIAKATGAKP